MNVKQGCLKPALFGCLGLIVVVSIGLIVTWLLAKRGLEHEEVADRQYRSAPADTAAPGEVARMPGRVVLRLADGEFHIRPGEPGDGVTVKARFDQNSHELIDQLEVLPDSTWVYTVDYRRTISGLQAFMRSIMGDQESRVDVFLPPDVPIVLDLLVQRGGGQAQFGGMWLREATIEYSQGGFELDISDPLVEPMDRLQIGGSMGGFEAVGLGNASPSLLVVDCSMGGAALDLRGRWLNSADVDLSVRMGGMAVMVPDELRIEGAPAVDEAPMLTDEDPEVPIPTLRLRLEQSMGEIEVERR